LDKTLTPLRFIDELDQEHLSSINLTPTKKSLTNHNLANKASKLQKEKIEYTKRVLLDTGLSVTALNHFIECPNKFFYKSILKLPEPPTASSEKGNAMHEALSQIWQNPTSDHTKIIISSVQNYFKHSLLPLFEKEAILEELLTNAPKVAMALLGHFKEEGKVSTESWVESYFAFPPSQSFGVVKELKLHGKMDTIIESEKTVLVFDYKTREAMSENAIKGQTQGSDGNYFRQLVFYKMLLASNYRYKDKNVEPALVFVKPDSKGRCPIIKLPIQKSDMEKVESEITSLIKAVWSGTLLIGTCNDKNCEYCGYNKLTK